MISEDYVSFETAKLLKEKGFPQNTFRCHYIIDGNTHYKIFEDRCGFGDSDIIAPTLAMAMKWLREIYSLEIYPYHDFPKVGDKWWFEIIKYPNSVSEYESETEYNSSEEACEAAIKYCLENLI